MCRAHATVRGFVGELVARDPDDRDLVIDMEAGLEHLSRGTGRHVSTFLAVLEPYFRSMETARRAVELSRELGAGDVRIIANKVRDAQDREAIESFLKAHDLPLAAEVPYDPLLAEAERAGVAPFDFDPEAPAVRAIRDLAEELSKS
jgi:CO dehydrogenase maturation factor